MVAIEEMAIGEDRTANPAMLSVRDVQRLDMSEDEVAPQPTWVNLFKENHTTANVWPSTLLPLK